MKIIIYYLFVYLKRRNPPPSPKKPEIPLWLLRITSKKSPLLSKVDVYANIVYNKNIQGFIYMVQSIGFRRVFVCTSV